MRAADVVSISDGRARLIDELTALHTPNTVSAYLVSTHAELLHQCCGLDHSSSVCSFDWRELNEYWIPQASPVYGNILVSFEC